MGDINANRLTISKQMLEGMVKDPNSKKLVDQILADGVVDSKDEAALGDLKKNLQTLAQKDDGKIDSDEESLVGSLTDIGWLTDEDVTKKNLQSIQALQKQHTSNPSALNFNTENPGVNVTLDSFIGADQTKVLRLRDLDPVDSSLEQPASTPTPTGEGARVDPPAQAVETPPSTPAAETPGGVTTPAATPTPVSSEPTPETTAPSQPATPSPAEQAYQQNAEQVLAPLKEQRDAAVKTLQDQATKLQEAYADPAKVPDDKLRGDLSQLADAVNDDSQFVMNTLKSMGITSEQLAKEGVISAETAADPSYVPFSEREKISEYLKTKQFSDTEVNAYRASLVSSLQKYVSDPSEANRLEMKAKVYDHSYVFEPGSGATPQGVTAGDLNTYTAFKQTLLDVGQKEKLLSSTQTSLQPGRAALPTTISEMNASLSRRNEWAQEDVIKFVGDAEALISQVEANPAAFNNVDISRLKSLVSQLGTTVPEPKLACVPLSASALTTLNETWAEIESVGLKAGLDKEVSDIVNAGLEQVNDGNPLSAALKSNPVLLNNPELARAISENPILLDALRSGDTAKVNSLLTQYSAEQTRRAVSYGFGALGSVMGAFGFGSLSNTMTSMAAQWSASSTQVGLNFGSGQSSLLGGSNFNLLGGGSLNLNGEGASLNLSGVSVSDIRALADSLAQTPQDQKDALFANLDNLSVAGQDDPAINNIQQQVAAKEAFDKAFWNKSSTLDMAQAGVSSSLERQNEFSAQLQLAKNAIEQQKSGNVSAEARKQLTQMSASIDVALAAIKKGEPIPDSVKSSIELVSRTLASNDPTVDLGESFLKVAESNSVLSQLRDQAADPATVQKFQARFNQLAEKHPELKPVKEQIDAFAASPEQYMADMERILSQPNLDPPVRAQIIANLNALQQLAQKTQQEGVSDEDLLSFGKTPTGQGAVKAAPIDAIIELGALSKFSQKQGETTNLGERVNTLYDWANKQATDAGGNVTRAQVLGSLGDNVKSYEKFYNKDLITNLAASSAGQSQIEKKVSSLLSSEGPTRTALQNIWSGNAGLSGNINLRGSSADLTKFARELEKRVGTLKGSTSITEEQRAELQASEALLLALKGPPGSSNVGLIAVATSRQETVKSMLGSAGQQMKITEDRLNDLFSDPAFSGSPAARALGDMMDIAPPQSPTSEDIKALCDQAPPHLRGKLQAVLSSHFAAMGYGTMSEQLRTGQPPLGSADSNAAVNLQARQLGNDFLLANAPSDSAPQAVRDKHARLLQEYNDLLNNIPPGTSVEAAVSSWVNNNAGDLGKDLKASLERMVSGDLSKTRGAFTVVAAGEQSLVHVATELAMPSLIEHTPVTPFENRDVPPQSLEPAGNPIVEPVASANAPTAPITTSSTTTPVTTGVPPATTPSGAPSAGDSPWMTMLTEGRRRRESFFATHGIQLDPNRPLGRARDRMRETLGLPPVSTSSTGNAPATAGNWLSLSSNVTGMRMTDIAQREASGQPISADVRAARADLQQDSRVLNDVASAMGSHATVLRDSVPFIAQTLGVELPPDLLAGLQSTGGSRSISMDDAKISQEAQSLVDQADDLANAILSPKPTVNGRDALSGLLKDFLENIRNLDFQTRKLVMAQFAKRLMNNMITKMYGEKNLENAKYHEKSMDQFKARMKEGIERSLEASEAQASSGQAAMAVGGDLGSKTGGAVADAGISDQALRDEASQFLEPAVQDGVLSRVQKQKILQALFDGSSVTGQEGLMSMLSRFQQARSSIVTQ